ncbi:MAG: hypothetical protein II661_00575 [Bacteroidales bacterium]|nr:hypothetical protein [Bacteroidales bacterium]
MTNDEKLEKIGKLMRTILMCPNGDTYKPIKGTTKSDCYRVLGEIQSLLSTNDVEVSNDDYLRVLMESKARQVYADSIIDEMLREHGLIKPGGMVTSNPDKTDGGEYITKDDGLFAKLMKLTEK